jgi:hypothetical protein
MRLIPLVSELRALERGLRLIAFPPRNFSREAYLENAAAAARMGSPVFSQGHDEMSLAGIFQTIAPVYDHP